MFAGWSSAGDPTPPSNSPEAEQLTAYQVGPQIWLRWHNHPLTSYRAHPSQKYPYFYPLSGPASGLSLTTETSQPWPHHRSCMFACDHVNGANYWQGDVAGGQIVSTNLRLGECTNQSAEILDECEWRVPGKEPTMRDKRSFKIVVPSEDLYYMDCRIEWQAVQDVTITKTNHSLFSVRATPDIAPDGGGNLLNSEGGRGAEETFGKPARWCTFYGQRKGIEHPMSEGIAILLFPEPWKDCPWFTRDYGFMSPTPFNFIEQPWKLEAGKSVTLTYRVVAYAGYPRSVDLDSIWRAFAEEHGADA